MNCYVSSAASVLDTREKRQISGKTFLYSMCLSLTHLSFFSLVLRARARRVLKCRRRRPRRRRVDDIDDVDDDDDEEEKRRKNNTKKTERRKNADEGI